MDHSESILEATSYESGKRGRSSCDIDTRQCDLVRPTLFKSLGVDPDDGLGTLDVLPAEILSSICLMLDVSAGFRFTQVSRRARAIVASVPEYHNLGIHALQCVGSLLRCGFGHHIAVTTVHSALVSQTCQSCGFYACYLFLPTATRCCFACIESGEGLSMAPLEKLVTISQMSVEQLKATIPIFHTVIIQTLQVRHKSEKGERRFLVAEKYCIEVLRSIGHPEPVQTYFSTLHLPGYGYEVSAALPVLNPKTGETQPGVSCKGCQVLMGTKPSLEAFRLRQRVYSREMYLEHFKDCEHAQAIWARSQSTLSIRS